MSISLRELLLILLALIGLGAGALCALLYAFQDRLIFYPQALAPGIAEELSRAVPRSEPFSVATNDGVSLHGWFVRGAGPAPWPLVIYFGGNAEEISWLVPEWARRSRWAVLLVNFRGYGGSGGEPSEQALFRDALVLYDRAINRSDIDRERVVAIGRSLGSGVATYLAAERPVAGVVLISPYDSLVRVAQGVYPFLPAGILLRHRFDSVARAPSIKAPLLAIVGGEDTLIRPERSRALVKTWGGPSRIEVLPGVGHNDVHLHPQYWTLIGTFLEGLERR